VISHTYYSEEFQSKQEISPNHKYLGRSE